MRMIRLFAAIVALSLRREVTFRVNFVLNIAGSVIAATTALLTTTVVYQHTATLGGWTVGEAIVLLGTYQIVSGFLATFVEPNVVWFGQTVQSGALDATLVKPVASLFLASLGTCAPLGLVQVVAGSVTIAIGFGRLGGPPAPWHVVGWVLMVACGCAICWATRVGLACLALWAPALSMDVVYGAVWQFGRFPVSVFDQPARFVLAWVIPLGLISTLPAMALVRGPEVGQLAVSLLAAIAGVVVVRQLWTRGLRRYASATS